MDKKVIFDAGYVSISEYGVVAGDEAGEIRWAGPGWYAPAGIPITLYACGDDPAREPDTYRLGLGTPEWIDAIRVSRGSIIVYHDHPVEGLIVVD